MTQPIQEPSTQRSVSGLAWGEAQLARRPSPVTGASGGPPVFRAAMGEVADPENDRIHYITGDEGDNVYWDQWDLTYDPTIYNTGPYEQTVLGIDVIAGVELLKRGLYSIHAIVDLNEAFNGVTLFKSNYDEGQGEFRAHANIALAGEPYYGDLYGIRLDHWRFVEVTNPDTTPPINYYADHFFGGAASDVEIVLTVNTSVAMPGVTPGVYDPGAPTVPIDGGDMWIPGGYDGAWGLVPQMIVAYWGDPTSGDDPGWPASFGLTRT